MRRNNPFHRLFSSGTLWTKDDIDDFFDSLEVNHEGYRREEVNGEVTEYVLEDGEWRELDPEPEVFDVHEDDGDYTLTLDVSGYIPYHNFDVSASLNNGVLEVEFVSKQ